ncbi:hypothetical protein IJ380_03415 [Candidatus Saccharibacteria bacterium]|nr:hypothetical protein [Candidatus Saccharibacteria bacterium]
MDNDSSAEKTSLSSSATHHRVQKSTTLNRRYVQRPEVSESAAIDSIAKRRADDLKRRQALADQINRERLAALKQGRSLQDSPAPAATQQPTQSAPVYTPAEKPLSVAIEKNLASAGKDERSSKEIKDSAIQKALKAAESVDESATAGAITSPISTKSTFGPKKLLLAFGCAALAVGVIGYFVSLNTPDLSVRVAAMQSGIEASYPSYVPRGYTLSDIVSEEGKLAMTFSNSENGSFELIEEKSAWDNETLESGYVADTWGTNYTSVREQGITIFISGSDAAWVNGGILYKINANGNNLTKKQIKSIVTSL